MALRQPIEKSSDAVFCTEQNSPLGGRGPTDGQPIMAAGDDRNADRVGRRNSHCDGLGLLAGLRGTG